MSSMPTNTVVSSGRLKSEAVIQSRASGKPGAVCVVEPSDPCSVAMKRASERGNTRVGVVPMA